uniref:G_PROTEIN_RECEP_F1_2 domain-containing protein n=1 Tax=Macrostomum lignano TaxID=282301 RepID=A0A1I8JNA8_9PLAT
MNETTAYNVTYCTTHMFVATVTVLFSLVVLLGFFGNLLVITPICYSSYFCVPPTVLVYIMGWVFGHAACVLFQYFTYVPVYGSVYTLVLMSADRYLAVHRPAQPAQHRSSPLPPPGLLISVCHVPFRCRRRRHQHGQLPVDNFSVRPLDICANRRFLDEFGGFSASGKLFYTCSACWATCCRSWSSITLYALLVRKLTCGRRAGVSKSGEAARSKRRVTRMVVIVIMWYKDFEDDWFRYLQAGSQMLAYMNSCVNPILYALPVREFPAAFAKFLGIQLKPKNPARQSQLGHARPRHRRQPRPGGSRRRWCDGDGDGEGDDDGEDGEVNGEGASANRPKSNSSVEATDASKRMRKLLSAEEPDDEESKPLNNTLELSAQVHRDCLDSVCGSSSLRGDRDGRQTPAAALTSRLVLPRRENTEDVQQGLEKRNFPKVKMPTLMDRSPAS